MIALPWTSRTRLTAEQQVALAVRILDNRHLSDVYDRMRSMMGRRAQTLGPIDLSRNSLLSGVTRLNRAHDQPPAVDGLTAEQAALMGDFSAAVTLQRYATIGARPMPTMMQLQSREVGKYRIGATYAGHLVSWSPRARLIYTEPVKPDALRLTFASDDPTEPTIIEHMRRRTIAGKVTDTTDRYDLTDLSRPSFKVLRGHDASPSADDLTASVMGDAQTMGDNWPILWTDSEGRPYHRIVISGSPDNPFGTMAAVEATLTVSMHWTAWGTGILDAGHPQRHVEGLVPVGADSSAETGDTGIEAGPETIIQWMRAHPDQPGQHWQDGPGYDPEVTGRAIRAYEVAAMNSLGLPLDYERTGGEPTEQERLAMEQAIRATFPEVRRSDALVLSRAAMMLNRLALPGVPEFSETPPAILYRDEVHEAMEQAERKAEAEAEASSADDTPDDAGDDSADE